MKAERIVQNHIQPGIPAAPLWAKWVSFLALHPQAAPDVSFEDSVAAMSQIVLGNKLPK